MAAVDIDMRVAGCDIEPEQWFAAWQAGIIRRGTKIIFTRPSATLAVSLTGTRCALDCAHCGGHYLRHMRPIGEVEPGAETSYLISGGCDRLGRVPVSGHLSDLRRLRPGRRMNWHVGLAREADLRQVLPYLDVISLDIIGDKDTAREVYGLDVDLDDYVNIMREAMRLAPVVPHITLGLRGGQLSGERKAMEALRPLSPSALILIILMPTEGTRFAACAPPALADVAALLVEARLMFPQTQISLGCMRPVGAYRQAVDLLAIRAGLDAIVNPSRAAEQFAADRGLEVTWRDECCALI